MVSSREANVYGLLTMPLPLLVFAPMCLVGDFLAVQRQVSGLLLQFSQRAEPEAFQVLVREPAV